RSAPCPTGPSPKDLQTGGRGVGHPGLPVQGCSNEGQIPGRPARRGRRVDRDAKGGPEGLNLLPDTSIWVEYLRHGKTGTAGTLDDFLERESVFVCGPVMAELLAGTRPERREELWLALGSLPCAVFDHAAWREAGHVGNDLRR